MMFMSRRGSDRKASGRRLLRVCAAASGFAVILGSTALVLAQPANDQPKPAPTQPQPQPQPVEPAQRQRTPGGGGGDRGGRPGYPNVEAAMRSMRSGMRTLRETVDKPDRKEDALTAVGQIQAGTIAAKGMKPEHFKQGASLDDYRREQIKLLGMLLELETQIMDGKGAEAKATYEKIAKHRDDSHKKFGGEEEEPGQGDRGSPNR